jgi:outer membrane receptor protein involved in Fe transport
MKSPLCAARGLSRLLLLSASVTIAAAQSLTPASSPTSDQTEGTVVRLSPFEVSSTRDTGYRKTMSTTSSRVAMQVVENPQAVEIISGDLLQDFGANTIWQAFRYSSSVTVTPNAVAQNNQFNLRGFQVPIYVNGVGIPSVGATFTTMVTDNIDRIEIAKGPIGLYYGVSTPNGVANYITKKPEFRDATTLQLSVGSYNFAKALLDTQSVMSRKLGLAYRLIGSYGNFDGRVEHQHGTDIFVAPSMAFRPNDKVEVSVEFDYTKAKTPYATGVYTMAINPQYYKDYLNPSAEIIQYMKTAYGLTSDADAQAKIVQRWGPSQTWATWLGNWVADTYGRTSTQPYYWSGSTIDWWRLSPRGDTMNTATSESDTNGRLYVVDSAVTLTPVKNLSVKYHWLQTQSNTQFDRELANPRGGLRSDGRFIVDTLVSGLTHQPENVRYQRNSTQQVDAVYHVDGLGMKHTFMAGLQYDHTVSASGAATVDFTKAKSIKDANGNIVVDNSTGVPIQLTGQNAYDYWDPWGNYLPSPLYDVIASEARVTSYTVTNYKAYYASYRGSALNDKLNVLAGIRNTESVNLNRKDTTPTLGAIYEVLPGFHAFASWSKTLTFTNQLSVTGLGVVPGDNAHLLDNEHDKGMEVGVKSDWNNNTISGTLSYYKDERNGVVANDAYRTITDPRVVGGDPNRLVAFYVNGGLQRAEGLDMDLSWTPNRNLQVLASGNYMWTAKIVNDPSLNPNQQGTSTYIHEKTLRLAEAPIWSGKLVVKYNFTNGMLKGTSVGGAVRYTDWWEYSSSGLAHVTVPTETLFDLFATYTTKVYGVDTTFKVNLINIGNTINDITRDNGFEGRLSMAFQF